jgi:hypothetical protein
MAYVTTAQTSIKLVGYMRKLNTYVLLPAFEDKSSDLRLCKKKVL